jgi:hypothetical protein
MISWLLKKNSRKKINIDIQKAFIMDPRLGSDQGPFKPFYVERSAENYINTNG